MRSVKELWNLGHVAYFAGLVLAMSRMRWISRMALPSQWVSLVLITLILGTLIEVLQYGTHRTPDLGDISRDLAGCLLVLAFYPGFLKLSSLLWMRMIRFIVAFILLILLLPIARAMVDETIAWFQFPVLSNFETPFELDRWKGGAQIQVLKMDPAQNSHQLKITLGTELYSGVGLEYFPSDWTGFESVRLRLFLPEHEALAITIRIHDLAHVTGPQAYHYHDRFNRRYTLKAGWNEIEIALSDVASLRSRKMNLSEVRDLSFFSIKLPKPVTLFLDKIYLSEK